MASCLHFQPCVEKTNIKILKRENLFKAFWLRQCMHAHSKQINIRKVLKYRKTTYKTHILREFHFKLQKVFVVLVRFKNQNIVMLKTIKVHLGFKL
jgi:hypothetical protein